MPSEPAQQPDLIVVRHGATPWSACGRHTSRTDLGLTPVGRAEARRLRPWLAQWSPATVWTSPLRRARETANACGFPDARVVQALHEWDYGDYEGLTLREIQAESPGWSVFAAGGAGADGESPAMVAARVDDLIARVRGHEAGPVLIFAHGHLLRALAARWLGQDVRLGARLGLDSGALGLLGRLHGEPALLAWNLRPADTGGPAGGLGREA
ncbi:histidine phosphatase family protein [Acidihalobacter prosperus]|uniref:Phosphoglycerate mutase n=1 Tax=Acidihalobacter prosperus TaxID=160660 RepID=A0A1A6C1W7_9GAMM|nr:histidine phosphatase family protein [Acidihalobacter prosperus]OBS08561.1 hypothetical protein Thpro_022811 [Acidihalobacter prosperus]